MNFYLWPRQDNKPRFTLLPETIKSLDKIYAINSFQTLDDKQFKTVIPERRETNHVSLIAPAHCLERVSRPGTGRGTRQSLGLPELRRRDWDFEELRQLGPTGRVMEEREICRGGVQRSPEGPP